MGFRLGFGGGCAPCCGGGSPCFGSCPAKTYTIRMTLSASDYRWSCPFLIYGIARTKHFYLPLSAMAGTYDLTKSGNTWSYTYPACGGLSPSKISVLDSPTECDIKIDFFGAYRLNSLPSCSVFDEIVWVTSLSVNNTFGLFDCVGGKTWAADSLAYHKPTLVTRTLDESVSVYSNGVPSTYTYWSPVGRGQQPLAGMQDGVTHVPNGAPSSSGSPIITITSATFV